MAETAYLHGRVVNQTTLLGDEEEEASAPERLHVVRLLRVRLRLDVVVAHDDADDDGHPAEHRERAERAAVPKARARLVVVRRQGVPAHASG